MRYNRGSLMKGENKMGVKEEWKNTGKDLGVTFAGLGKSIVRSVKVGADIILDEEPKDENGNIKPNGLKESWTEVGRNFGKSGKALGKSVTVTAKAVVKKADEKIDDISSKSEKAEAPEEEPLTEEKAEETVEEKTEE